MATKRLGDARCNLAGMDGEKDPDGIRGNGRREARRVSAEIRTAAVGYPIVSGATNEAL